jgi:hypothetical protein
MKHCLRFRAARESCALFIVLLAMNAALSAAQAQRNPPVRSFPPPPGTEQQQRNKTPAEEQVDRDTAKQRNLQREQDIRRDTEKLLELATELKQYVDKTNENVISLDVIKKADQIEKLAKSVKDKMKQ